MSEENLIIQARHDAKEIIFRRLAKSYFSFCQAVKSNPKLPEVEQRYQALIRDLALYELSVSKLGVIQDTSKRDLLLHQHELDAKKGQVQQKLQELKELESELNEEKVKRKHREQYDMLAGSILQVPDRASQTREMEALEKELQALENENAQLSEKLDLRKKQFHLLLHTIRALEQELDEKEGDVVAASVSGGGATTTTPLATETNTVK